VRARALVICILMARPSVYILIATALQFRCGQSAAIASFGASLPCKLGMKRS